VTSSRPAAVIVLAAGVGTRMKSSTPKVLHPLLGRSLLAHVLGATRPLDAAHTMVVVGHQRDAVTEHLAEVDASARAVVQAEQNGTGHAVRIVLDALPDVAGAVVVVCGDTPLLTPYTLHRVVAEHDGRAAAATVLTAHVPDPTGYGRVVRGDDGNVRAIVEHGDADGATLAVDEVNSGIYVFDAALLRSALDRVSTENSQGEEYLTDVVGILVDDGARVQGVAVNDPREVMGINDRVQLAEARAVLRDRINNAWMRAGVSIIDPTTTFIGVDVQLAADCVIHPWTLLEGASTVAAGAEVGPGSQIVDTLIGPGATVRFTTADRAVVGPDASVGPYTYLRPGTELAKGARAGAFVEAKNVQVGEGSKIPHLSYVGDAEIGEGSNIGAATVFVNYDGVAKHRTIIGDHVRIGSDTMLVAPVTVGDGAYTAAGSVITDDVPPGAMGVGRARQRTIRDWVLRKRRGTASAVAAERAQRSAAPAPDGDTGETSGDNGPARTIGDPHDPEGTGA
jgi:bifunctional UDP-N-acetylglucosamine pyrophosphorylase / glucosamine-1-phosphate N-acetyltransferase